MREHTCNPGLSSSPTRHVLFDDVYEAGELLATRLQAQPHVEALERRSTVIVGVTEGGLPLAYMVAAAMPVRVEPAPVASIRAPHQRDVRTGMLVDDGTLYVDERVGLRHGAHGSTLDHLADRADEQLLELMRRIGDAPGIDVDECDVIVVDDVIDTGMTTIACVDWLRRWGARSVHMAAAVATPQGLARARDVADSVVVLSMLPEDMAPADAFARRHCTSTRAVTALAAAMDILNLDREHPLIR